MPATPTNSSLIQNAAYRAFLNEHPYTREMIEALNQFGVEGLLHPSATNGLKRQSKTAGDFSGYNPTTSVVQPHPQTDFDFSFGGPYSIYNWEIFFHMVTLIARQLRLSNKHAEAIRWLNYVFDPADPDEQTPKLEDLRFWQIKPFLQNVSHMSIRNMIRLLSSTPTTAIDIKLKSEYQAQIAAWRANPFDPHIIAGMRPRAYMLWTVMEYITTLTDWGDYLFRQDTTESINEAINLYIIAQEILGKRPRKVKRPSPPNKNFNDIGTSLSAFSNVLVAFENNTPSIKGCTTCDRGGNAAAVDCGDEPSANALNITDLLFCIPDNPQMVALWDRVEDRLFKIRHCMNIDGKVRQLALFSPPIDPAMLVAAAAAGLSVEDALADMVAPLPHYRFTYMLQKANEFCSEVKSIGAQILGHIEKRDAEDLALFRQVHEQNILKAAQALKQMAIDEAKQNLETLKSSKNLIQIRLNDYSARKEISTKEQNALNLTQKSETYMLKEQNARLVGSILALIPDFTFGVSGVASSPVVTFNIGGSKLSAFANIQSQLLSIYGSIYRNAATQSSTLASYERRSEDWKLQIKSATEELAQVDRQLVGSQIRISVTEKELENHQLQIAQSEEMHDWLKNKYTNANLYAWMLSQVTTVYRQAFDLAFTMAKRAQRCMEYELGISANTIQYGQWDSSRAGFLAGERLSLQLKQLENKYIENNKRDLEISKNISLALLDPLALEELKMKGFCTIEIPEVLFGLDFPGHYNRRIKTISISIPCIAGAQTSVSATLSLTDHAIRPTNSNISLPFDSLPLESIVTSTAQNDSGVFELNFKDERYLPFEGRGAVSRWTLHLTQIDRASLPLIKQFDFNTISDVVLHMKYTATDGGANGTLGTHIKANLKSLLDSIAQGIVGASSNSKLHYGISLRHDMPNEWHEFKQTGETDIKFLKSRLPYFIQAMSPAISEITFIALAKNGVSASNARLKFDSNFTSAMAKVFGTDNPIKGNYYKVTETTTLSFDSAIHILDHWAGTTPATSDLVAADIEDIAIIVNVDIT
jgi:hypothetical protein